MCNAMYEDYNYHGLEGQLMKNLEKLHTEFETHTGEVLDENDPRLIAACEKVACWYEENARAVRKEDKYASHVTEETKDAMQRKQYAWAEQVRQRENLHNFSVWQRVNAELTGESIALFYRHM